MPDWVSPRFRVTHFDCLSAQFNLKKSVLLFCVSSSSSYSDVFFLSLYLLYFFRFTFVSSGLTRTHLRAPHVAQIPTSGCMQKIVKSRKCYSPIGIWFIYVIFSSVGVFFLFLQFTVFCSSGSNLSLEGRAKFCNPFLIK